MDLKVTNYNFYRSEMKFRLALFFAIISATVCIFYTITFIAVGMNIAAAVQLMGAFIFMTIVGLLRRRVTMLVRQAAIMTSLGLVYVQTAHVFGSGYGFHYMLFPLLVVIFLLLDFNMLTERLSIYLLTGLALVLFFICEWVEFSPVEHDTFLQPYFFGISIFSAFAGMLLLLYFLSKDMFTTKDLLYSMATVDMLTNLFNRRTFFKRGEEFFKIATRGGNSFSVLLFDIDHFKSVNDEYGHRVGDIVLQEMAQVIQENVRETDVIGRYGGEEFAVLLPLTTPEQAKVVAEKLRLALANHTVLVKPYKIQRTVSIGIMGFDLSIESFSDMMDKADKAMYKSKAEGRNMTIIYSQKDPFYREKRQVYDMVHKTL